MLEALSRVVELIVGFLDEASLQLNLNKRRVINTRVVKYMEGEGKSKTIFGFMALNGNDVVMVSDKARKEDMRSFIEIIRKEDGSKPIIIVMETFQYIKQKW